MLKLVDANDATIMITTYSFLGMRAISEFGRLNFPLDCIEMKLVAISLPFISAILTAFKRCGTIIYYSLFIEF